QYVVDQAGVDKLNELDAALDAACRQSDEKAFHASLDALLDGVRSVGQPHPVDEIAESDLILPGPDATIAEVTDLLGDDGLIPG
ncbi:MAG: hypothetical protein J2O46_10470, partial [Nocardioides sp.]|nr:hypothetical protein [Nocardioides sp.]